MLEDYTLFADLAGEVKDIPSDGIISRTLVHNEAVKVVLFGFGPGQFLSQHSVPQYAILHFLDGEAEVTFGEDTFTAQPGAWVHMPPSLVHSIKALTPLKMLLLMLKP